MEKLFVNVKSIYSEMTNYLSIYSNINFIKMYSDILGLDGISIVT
jgi:hypothetical protein